MIKKIMLTSVILLCNIGFTQTMAAQRSPAATVISAFHADASNRIGKFSPIHRRSTLFPHQWVRTHHDGVANVRFNDGFLLKIRKNSTVGIKKYFYSKQNRNGKIQLNLQSNANILFISGKIPNRDVRINTHVGVVGIRGTAATIWVDDNQAYFSTIEGKIKYCCKHCHLKTAHDTNPNRPQCVEVKKGELLYQNPQGGITKQNIPPEIMEKLEEQKTDLETSTTTQDTTTPTEDDDQPNNGHALTHTHSLTNNNNLANTTNNGTAISANTAATATASGTTEENTASPGAGSSDGYSLTKAS